MTSYDISYVKHFAPQFSNYLYPDKVVREFDPISGSFVCREEDKIEGIYSTAAEAAVSKLHAEQASRRDASALLAHPEGRKACMACMVAAKAYSADAEQYATRSVVRQAVGRLIARRFRREARQVAEAARTVKPGRTLLEAAQRAQAKLVVLHRKSMTAVESAADGLYKVSGSKWAGGKHTTRVEVGGAVGCSGSSSRSWSKNGKWSGSDSSHTFQVKSTWLQDVKARDLEVCGGMLTLDAEPIRGHGPELFQAVWAEQGRGFDLKAVSGYIARSTDGTTYHAPSARSALDGLARKLGQKPARRKGTLDLDRLVRRHGELPVVLADSLAVGNCESGTLSWCRAVGIAPHAVASLREIVTGYKLRPLPEVLAVLRRVVRDRHNRTGILGAPSALEREGLVIFDAEGGFRIVPSDN